MAAKKFFLIYILFCSMLLAITKTQLYAIAQVNPQETVDLNESGREKLIKITKSVQNVNVPFNGTEVQYAQSSNVPQELDIAALVNFFDCKTGLGKQYLTDILSNPISPQDQSGIIESRKNCIRALVENPALKKDVEKYLNEAQIQEQEIITLFSDSFIEKNCPEQKNLEILKQQRPWAYRIAKFLASNRAGKAFKLTFRSTLLTGTSIGAALCVLGISSNQFSDEEKVSLGLICAGCGLYGGLNGYRIYDDYSSGSQKRIKIHALNRFIAIAENTEALCNTHKMPTQFKFASIQDKNTLAFIKGLKLSRYKAKNTIVFDIPAVHSFLFTVYEKQSELGLLFASIAELDMYNAVATKMLEYQEQNNRLCFITYPNEEAPTASENYQTLLQNRVLGQTLGMDYN